MHKVNRDAWQMRPAWIAQHPAFRAIVKEGIEVNYGHYSWYNLAGGDCSLMDRRDDPLFFPGLMSDELLEKIPPMVVSSAEFCFFVEEAKHLIGRLRRKGKLLDSLVIPGGIHVSWLFCLPGTDRYFQDRRMLSDRHLVGYQR